MTPAMYDRASIDECRFDGGNFNRVDPVRVPKYTADQQSVMDRIIAGLLDDTADYLESNGLEVERHD